MADYFMLLSGGEIQYVNVEYHGQPEQALPVTRTHSDAKRLAQWSSNPKASPGRIGSVQGESVERVLRAAKEAGAVAVCCVLGWEEDGSPRWGFRTFDEFGTEAPQ